MEGEQTADELARVKWYNFMDRFSWEIEQAAFEKEEIEELTWDNVQAAIRAGWLVRAMIDNEDADGLRVMIMASDLRNAEQVVATYEKLDDHKRRMFWRYAKFFFNTVLC